jgi:hypothetical protein
LLRNDKKSRDNFLQIKQVKTIVVKQSIFAILWFVNGEIDIVFLKKALETNKPVNEGAENEKFYRELRVKFEAELDAKFEAGFNML